MQKGITPEMPATRKMKMKYGRIFNQWKCDNEMKLDGDSFVARKASVKSTQSTANS